MIITKFLRILNPKRGYYTHDDQTVDGLKFRTITHGANHVTLLIKGEETKVNAYITREKAIVIPDSTMKSQYDTDIPVKVHDCPECGAVGAITIPEFDLVKAKGLLNKEIKDVI